MLSPEKTKIVSIEQGFDFLNQYLRKFRNKLIITPSKENIKSFLDKVRKEIKACRGLKCETMIRTLNPKIRGWCNCHRSIHASQAFSVADGVVFYSLWRWCKRRHPGKSAKWIKKKYFDSSTRKWMFSCTIKDKKGNRILFELLRASHTQLVRYHKIKGKSNPYDPEYRDYFKMRRQLSNVSPIR